MEEGKKQDGTINILMNIENYFGEHNGSMGRTIKFILISAAPFVLYIFLLGTFIPLKWAIIFEILWTLRMALLILGRENDKLAIFLQTVGDEYSVADNLVCMSHVHEDGLMEYENGSVGYIISAYARNYYDEDSFTIELEEFMRKMEGWTYDVTCQLVVDEFKLQNNMENMSVYEDRDIMQERMEFYIQQDDFCRRNTTLFRINYILKCPKYDWKKLKAAIKELVSSRAAGVFYTVYVCDQAQVNDVLSRDLCLDVDLEQMLCNKYKNVDYAGSKIMYFDDEIPEKLKPEVEVVNLEGRRMTEESIGEEE